MVSTVDVLTFFVMYWNGRCGWRCGGDCARGERLQRLCRHFWLFLAAFIVADVDVRVRVGVADDALFAQADDLALEQRNDVLLQLQKGRAGGWEARRHFGSRRRRRCFALPRSARHRFSWTRTEFALRSVRKRMLRILRYGFRHIDSSMSM